WCTPPGAACAGWLGWGCRSITLSVAEDSLPDASENESSLISAAGTDDMRETVIVFPEQCPALIPLDH
nr:hypothetical protein [Providencia rettgeri]ELR5144573.1 hypothetical protein [Providencia stuartii]